MTAVRSSGFGIAYSFAVLPASFYVVYLGLRDNVMPHRYTQLVLLAVGVALTVAGALLGPETVRTDLSGGVPDRATAVPTTPIDGQVNEAMSGHRELHPEATRPVAAVRPRRPG